MTATALQESTSALDWPRDGQHAFIGGEWLRLAAVEQISAISPIDESVIGQVAATRAEHVDQAVAAAQPALRAWASLDTRVRARYLREFAQAIRLHADALAELDTLDAGLTVRTARRNVANAADDVDLYASFAAAVTGRTYSAPGRVLAYTVREPFGIAAVILPFNHPAAFAIGHSAPALLAGNAVIVKPPEQASLSTLALAEIAKTVFPPGIFSVLTGYGREVGAALVAHPDIPRIDFAGGVEAGKAILRSAADHIKRVSLELGGKNPLVVTPDADPERAATIALKGMNFTHAGQSCMSTSRVLLPDNLYEDVVQRLAKKMSGLVVGDPREQTTDTGPLGYREHYERVCRYVEVGVEEGARLVTGGRRPDGLERGFYLQPALFADVTQDMTIAKEEIFGPVVSVMRYQDVPEAIAIANATEFGLNSRVVAGDVGTAIAISREIKAGIALLNTAESRPRGLGLPAGGWKHSGIGKQACVEEVLSYTQEKCVVAELPEIALED